MACVHVPLTLKEILSASQCGIQRQISSFKKHSKDRAGYRGPGWENHIVGAIGELALAKFLGVKWDKKVDTYKSVPDVGDRHEVRTRTKHHYELIVRNGDPSDRIYWLVTTENGRDFFVRGWGVKSDARGAGSEYLKNHGGRDYSYFVPQDILRDPRDRSWETINSREAT